MTSRSSKIFAKCKKWTTRSDDARNPFGQLSFGTRATLMSGTFYRAGIDSAVYLGSAE